MNRHEYLQTRTADFVSLTMPVVKTLAMATDLFPFSRQNLPGLFGWAYREESAPC